MSETTETQYRRPSWGDVRAEIDRAILAVSAQLQDKPDGELAADLAELVKAAAAYGESTNKSIAAAQRAKRDKATAERVAKAHAEMATETRPGVA